MAVIEKICEFSGEYPSYFMYGYKRNHIQIMPEYRKLFRGAKAKLIIFDQGLEWKCKYGGTSDYNKQEHMEEMLDYEPPFENYQEFIDWEKKFHNKRLVKSYEYVLQVFDEKLFGDVEGKYLNYTNNISTVKRKLKRMLRCENLEVKYVNTHEELLGE